MNKTSLLILGLFLFSFVNSQTPVPVQGFDLSTIQGLWYVTGEMSPDVNNTNPTGITCYTLNIEMLSDTNISFTQTIYTADNQQVINNYYTYSSVNSAWENSDILENIDWISIDPILFSWALIAYPYADAAIYLSRSPSIPGGLQNLLNSLLIDQQFSFSSQNVEVFTNQCNL